jgi:DNA-binding transcriptional regulator YdaS (Cro superfamily)
MDDIIDKACEAAGGLAKLAVAIGQSAQTVSNWRTRGVPVVHCAEIERVTHGAVTRRDLRPDDWQRIWPELAEPTKAAA